MYVAKLVLCNVCMMYNIDQSITDNVYVIIQKGQTALHIATSHNQLEIVEFLIIKGAKLDIKDDVSSFIFIGNIYI